jgi:hypothetical protein
MKTTTLSIVGISALVALSGATGCSSLDPNIGGIRIDQPVDGDGGVSEGGTDADDTPGEGMVSFGRDIRPIIMRTRDQAMMQGTARGCIPCHQRNASSHTGLDLSGFAIDTLGDLRQGGGSSGTRIIVPGKPGESVLVQVLKGTYSYAARMPKGAMIYWSADEIKLVEDWIREGAKGLASE